MKKAALKRSVDLLMTAALLALMSYSLIGEAAHEWIGVGMAPLFILHLGLHWTMVLNAAQLFAVTRTKGFRALGALTALYGAYAFWKRGFPGYLLLRTHFLFLDYEEPTLFSSWTIWPSWACSCSAPTAGHGCFWAKQVKKRLMNHE